jgi:hypothetical protein
MSATILAASDQDMAYSSRALPSLSMSLVEGSTADANSGGESLRWRVRAEAGLRLYLSALRMVSAFVESSIRDLRPPLR